MKGWHTQWFYYKNHEPSLPPFIGRLLGFEGSWTEELIAAKKVSKLKRLGLTRVNVATNWLAY
jgi:hypothetical protein